MPLVPSTGRNKGIAAEDSLPGADDKTSDEARTHLQEQGYHQANKKEKQEAGEAYEQTLNRARRCIK